MTNAFNPVDLLLFVLLPYAAVLACVAGTVVRYRRRPYSLSSYSSQFLENRQQFWGAVPFHYGILPVLVGHVIAFAVPGLLLAWSANTTRLYALEVAGLALGLLATAGITVLIARRVSVRRLRALAKWTDWVIYVLLAGQLVSGLAVAVLYPWGSSWFASAISPYLWSLARLQPEAALVGALPLAVKGHLIGAFLLLAVFPFSRLVHMLAVPNAYLWRRPQLVRWYRPAGLR